MDRGVGWVGGCRGGGKVLEKQKIKMSKMAATAAIFDILIFCFSKTGTLAGLVQASRAAAG